jgi:hypothetical protein
MPLNHNKILKLISVGILYVPFTTFSLYVQRFGLILPPTVSLGVYSHCMHVVNDGMFNDEI